MDINTHFALEITRQRHRAMVAAANRERDARLARTDLHPNRTRLRWPFGRSRARSFPGTAGAPGKP
jgi:hypothetical protein